MFHFVENDSVYFGNLMDEFPESLFVECYDYKKDTYLYMHVCKECMQRATTFRIYHSKKLRQVCMVPSLSGTILRRSARERTEMILSSLKAIGRSSKTSNGSSAFCGARRRYNTGKVSSFQEMNEYNGPDNI